MYFLIKMDSAFIPKPDPTLEYFSKIQYANYNRLFSKLSSSPQYRLFLSQSIIDSSLSYFKKSSTVFLGSLLAGITTMYYGTRIWGLRRIERRWLRNGVILAATGLFISIGDAFVKSQNERVLFDEFVKNQESYRRYKLTGDIKYLLRQDLRK